MPRNENVRPKLGFGFYHHMLNDEGYTFARQCGATHAVVHLVDYKYGGDRAAGETVDDQPVGSEEGWGIAGHTIAHWDESYLLDIKERMARFGLTLAAIENFDPIDWYDVLLDGPRRDEQIETIKRRIETAGAVGVPVIGYNFSITGVTSRSIGPYARGGARSVGMEEIDTRPLPSGLVWNMWVDRNGTEVASPATAEQVWSRWCRFIEDVLPTAERAGVVLAAHPDDPPVPEVRGQPKLGWSPDRYLEMIDCIDSPSNALELCLGTLAEMEPHDLYETVRYAAKRRRIGYVHFRNVVGHAPHYREVFIDEGAIDMRRVVSILIQEGYEGVLIPDHTPQMRCASPWHAGMAYAMGYMRALLTER